MRVNYIKTDEELIEQIEAHFKESKDHLNDWREETIKCYAYVSGDQWDEEEISYLEEQGRPPIVFNKTEVFVGAIAGLEALNRMEVKFMQRVPGQASAYEIMNAAAQYINDDSDAEDHHSHAFKDLVTCGMGWTDTFMRYDTNADGDVAIERVDPLQMFWDTRSTHRCLTDARWVMRIRDGVSYEELKERWPDKADSVNTGERLAVDLDERSEPHSATTAWQYADDQSRRVGREDYQLIQYQWFETENVYRVATNQGVVEIEPDRWERMKEQYPAAANARAIKMPKRVYYQAFACGKEILEAGQAPIQKGFTLKAMTGRHDRNKNIWYGIVRSFFDPQDWTNKLFSQILHIINSNAKGGLLAEMDTFEDVRQAEDSWAQVDSITWAKPGAIAGKKIMPKPPPPYPQGMDRLMQVAISMFPEVSGMNLELLGLADKVQPGVLEAQRKQAGMTLLAWAFDSMRNYRKQHGRVLAEFIRRYISDGRLIRVAGQDQQQYLPLIKDAMAMEYDLVVDEAPASPNQKERVFAIFTQLLPILADQGVPFIPELLEYSPLPQALVEKWKQAMRPKPEQMQAQQMAQELQLRDAAAEVDETKSKTVLNLAKAESERKKKVN